MGFTVSDIADWWDEQDKKTEKILDDWIMDSTSDGEIALKVVPQAGYKLASFVGGSFVDALRLGKGTAEFVETGSKWALFEDVTRLLVIAGPLAKAVAPVVKPVATAIQTAAKARAGVKAASGVIAVAEAEGPCTFVALQNAMSFVKGKTVQMFSSLGDILKYTKGGKNVGIYVDELLLKSEVIQKLKQLGIVARNMGLPRSIEDVVQAVRNSKGPVIFSVKWLEIEEKIAENIHRISRPGHTFMAYKDWLGRIRYMDYADGPVGRAFASIEEAMARGAGWQGISKFEMMTRIVEYPGHQFKLLGQMFAFEGVGAAPVKMVIVETLEGIAHWAMPVQLAAFWEGKDKSPESMVDDIQDFAQKKGTPLPIEIKPAVPKAKTEAGMKRALTTRTKKAATAAPRADWLTGVQFRLNYLGFQSGPVDGIMGPKTRLAVRAFQKKHCTMVDGIPGKETQGNLADLCGF